MKSKTRREPKQISSENSLQRAGSWALTLTVALLPLVYWPTANDVNLAKSLLLIIGLLVVTGTLVARAARGERLLPRLHTLDLCVGMYTLVVCASWTYSAYQHATIGAVQIGLTYAILYFAARMILTDDKARARLVLALLLGCAAVSLVGVYERFGDLPWGNPAAVSSTWFNRTYLAAYMLTVVPMAAWAALDKRAAFRVAGLIALLSSSAALIFTAARVAWLGVLPMLAVALFGVWPLLSGERRRLVAKAIVAAVVLGGVFLVVSGHWFSQWSPVSVIAKAMATKADPANRERLGLMKTAIRVGMHRPVMGGGAGTFGVYAPENAHQDCYVNVLNDKSVHGSVVLSHAHNEFLEVFAELGIVGLIAFISMPVAAGCKVRGLLRRKDVSVTEKWLAIALLVGITGFLAANLVGRSARVPGEAAFAYLFLALLGSINCSSCAWKEAQEQLRGLKRNAQVVAPSVACLLLLVIGWSGVTELRSSIYIERGELLLRDSRNKVGAAAAVEQFQMACEITPADPGPWYELANALAVSGRHSKALRAYGVVERLSPSYGRLHFNRGTSLFNVRKYYAAEREMSLAYKQDGLPDSRARLNYLRKLLRRSDK